MIKHAIVVLACALLGVGFAGAMGATVFLATGNPVAAAIAWAAAFALAIMIALAIIERI